MLIDAGADVNAKGRDGYTPLHSSPGEATKLLIGAGADVNAKDNNGWTPLHNAAGEGVLKVAEWLIDAGADVNAKNNNGQTPLHCAVVEDHLELVRLLLFHNANVLSNEGSGETPLDIAKNKQIRELLGFCTNHELSGILRGMKLGRWTVKFYDYDPSLTMAECRQFTEDDLEALVGIDNALVRRKICIKLGLKRSSNIIKRISERLSTTLSIGKFRYDAFLTHDWGTDKLGRDNHQRVSKINKLLTAAGLVIWFDEERIIYR